ncbi:MAG: hypothetical protein JAY60_18515 [Candidatus Thiodiazotropha weberae]|nr:hypothetical protein [Candidatus Thiodiazotropha weberae]
MNRLFQMALLAIVLTLISFYVQAEDYFNVEILYITSDHGVEGQIDTHFDQRLFELGRSTSERLFGDEPMGRYGALFSKRIWHGDAFAEFGGFIDANGLIVGHSDLGDIHVRQDSVGVLALGGYRFWRLAGGIGPYAAYTESDVHSWLLHGHNDIREFHDSYRDFSAGLMLKAYLDLDAGFYATCDWKLDFGEVDKTGTDNVLSCGIGSSF